MRIVFVSILLFLSGTGFAQRNGGLKIIGKVYSNSSQKALEYATIAVINKTSGKTAAGTITDVKGAFEITGLSVGQYEVHVDFIGHLSRKVDSVFLTDGKQVTDLGVLYLLSSGSDLTNVTVIGRAPIVEQKIDRIVYNAVNDITSQGGAAIDVLKKVPQVSVDVDGKVELQGNPNVRFLINGKPSSMFGNSLADALASIPASQIKSIEAITSPGARYDAQGTAGIINIILKDNKAQGFNGSVNVSAGTRLENGAVNLNVRHNNFGVNVYFNGNLQLSSHTPATQERLSIDTAKNSTTHFLQDGYSDFKRNGYQTGIGFDWNLSKTDNLNATLSYNHFGNQGNGIINQVEITDGINNNSDTVNTTRFSESYFKESSVDWSLAYKKKFKREDQELDILYAASYGVPYSDYRQYQTYAGDPYPFAGTAGNNPGTDRQNNFSIDYVHPFNDRVTLETGAKMILQNIYSSSNVSAYDGQLHEYLPDELQSYQLNYKQQVYGAYVSTKFSLFNFVDAMAGLRYEYTHIDAGFANVTVPSYGTLAPSIILSHTFDKNTLKLAYTRRLERAEYEDLNPFINLSDPHNISTGNPFLKPEIGDNIELGYNHSFKNGSSIYCALSERINSQDHKPFTEFYPSLPIGDSVYDNVSVTTRRNIGTEYNTGLIVSGTLKLMKNLNVRGNTMLINKRYVNNLTIGNSNGVSFRINMNAAYTLPKDLVLEAFGDYRSASKSIQGKQAQRITYTFAFRKQFLHKNASIGVTATNPFNKYINQVSTVATENYVSSATRKIPYRSFGISFTYKFGKLLFKEEKDQGNDFLNNPPSM